MEVAMSRLRARIERLEQRIPPTRDGVNWDNLWRRREDIVPDGIIDWEAMYESQPAWSAEECPIERAIAAVGLDAACPKNTIANPAPDERP
jgi:hypothetical protein